MNQPIQPVLSAPSSWKRVEAPWLLVLVLATTAFLLKLPYLPTGLIAVLTAALVGMGYGYVRIYYGIRVPWVVVVLLMAAVAVDALGNYFRMYGRPFGPIMYDEFAHCTASALTIPAIIWLLKEMIERRGHRLSLSLIVLFGIACSYSAAAFYEVIELWDELYFGGKRIWSPYDAPRDLQWDLIGKLIGAWLTYLVLKRKTTSALVTAMC